MPSDIYSKRVDKGVDRLMYYKILDIIDLKTGEPKHNGFYRYYVGQICKLSKDIDECLGGTLFIHRFTGELDGSVAIATSHVEKIIPNEAESAYELITENTCYVLREWRGEIKNGKLVDIFEINWDCEE